MNCSCFTGSICWQLSTGESYFYEVARLRNGLLVRRNFKSSLSGARGKLTFDQLLSQIDI